MTSRGGPKGLYNIREQQSDPLIALFRAAGLLVLGFVASLWIATELMAQRLGYQRALGEPLTGHVYEPWAGVRWWFLIRGTHDARLASVGGVLLQTVTAGIVVSVVLAVALVMRSARRASEPSDVHGSAHWASEREIEQTGLLKKGDGVYVGAVDVGGRTRYLRHDGPEHVLAFAPTRSGKGVGLVLPTLLSWPHSVVVHDIKGENFALTAGWRARDLGSRVLRFDPANGNGESARFNPLDQIRIGTDNEVKDVQNIVQILVDPDGKAGQGDEAHWIATSSALLLGVILHVVYAEPNKTLAGVATFLSSPDFETPAQMYETMLNADHDGPAFERGWTDSMGRPTRTHPAVAMAARDMLNKDPKEATGVLSTAIRFLTLFRDPIVARNTSASDFTIESLMNDEVPVSLFLIVPPSDIDRLKPLTRIILNQILRTLTSEMHFEGGRSVARYRHRLLFMIDELPSLGRLEVLQNALAFMAGYGIKAYLIAQDVAQLTAAYGGPSGRDETIVANCHIQVAYAPNKIETMELLSKMAGTMTIRQENRSYSGSRVGVRNQVMVNQQEMQRPLLTPDEARRLPADDALIFVAGHAPIYGKKIKYYADPVFAARAKVAPPSGSGRPEPVAAAAV